MKKTVLITGTSSGLGLKMAILLAKNGYNVYASMRDTGKNGDLLAEAAAENVALHVVQLDVSDNASVNTCVQSIIEKEGSLDVLINNAGAGFAKTTEQASLEEIDWVIDVNYLSVVRCTKAVLPQMRQQKGGHIINITSVGGLVGQPFNELYCGAKFAVEGYTEALATYLTAPFGIKLSIVEPGGIATAFNKSAVAKTLVNGKMSEDAYLPILQKYMAGIQKRAGAGTEKSYQTPEEVAEVVLQVLQSENPPLRIRTSQWAEDFCQLKTMADPDGTVSVNRVKTRFLE